MTRAFACLLQGPEAIDQIYAMVGTLDMSGESVLIISYLEESVSRLYSIPDFKPRGVLTPVGPMTPPTHVI